MEQPPDCDPDMYQLMQQCWMTNRNDRPTFMIIIQKLLRRTEHGDGDFLTKFRNDSFFASQANRLTTVQQDAVVLDETGDEASTEGLDLEEPAPNVCIFVDNINPAAIEMLKIDT